MIVTNRRPSSHAPEGETKKISPWVALEATRRLIVAVLFCRSAFERDLTKEDRALTHDLDRVRAALADHS